MFCRNCGKELTGSPEFCMNCGAKPMAGTSFCPGCGAQTTPMTEICTKCGVKVAPKAAATGGAWMPVTAGILDLVVGVPGLIIGMISAVVGGFLTFFVAGLGALIGAPMIILSIVAIVGGIFAIRKRAWGFALAGAICGFAIGLPLVAPAILFGIPAIVFTVLGKGKFE
ncbi:MAG: zinc ribbon domain-containing protein [Dehalococcoidia bacterium]|nr:zinc ribbon domain-containing protein [Dehalococcoidia bacterium]